LAPGFYFLSQGLITAASHKSSVPAVDQTSTVLVIYCISNRY
jgi:hypothetical protein